MAENENDGERLGLDDLRPSPGSKHARKRVGRGRGSGRGKTSGRGHKGQKARTGASIPAWFEGGQMPLYRRLPKRGFTSRNPKRYQIVNLKELEELEGTEFGPEELARLGLVGSADRPVKILAEGTPGRAVTVRAHAFSASARERIEAEGGSAELID